MSTKIKNFAVIIVFGIIIFGLSLTCILKGSDEYSFSERRYLDQLPEISLKNFLDGKFTTDFEDYTLDQFPFRDQFRTIKAFSAFYIFRQKDNNDIYIAGDHAAKIEYPLSDNMLNIAIDKFESLYNTYFKDKGANIYFSTVPDKNAFLHSQVGCPVMDYDYLQSTLKNELDFATYLDIFPLLSIDDYYTTDHHWRQEKIQDVAEALADLMGTDISAEYTTVELNNPFYGVYYGQAALPLDPDNIKYLASSIFDSCTVTSYNTGKPLASAVYTLDKATSKDPYEIFLNGADPLLVVENPNANTDKELILFRDSFGSSIAPLLIPGYSKVTLIDIRYINSSLLGSFVNFDNLENTDILYLYSTLVINSANAFK